MKDNNKLYNEIELNDSWADDWINSDYSSFLQVGEHENFSLPDDCVSDVGFLGGTRLLMNVQKILWMEVMIIDKCFGLLKRWFVGCTGCTLQTLYAWLVRGLYVCMVGILIYRILCPVTRM